MNLEYKQIDLVSTWGAYFNEELIAQILVKTSSNCYDIEEGETKVFVHDKTTWPYDQIPGSPFPTMNQAKAVLEWHFRDWIDKRTEYGTAS